MVLTCCLVRCFCASSILVLNHVPLRRRGSYLIIWLCISIRFGICCIRMESVLITLIALHILFISIDLAFVVSAPYLYCWPWLHSILWWFECVFQPFSYLLYLTCSMHVSHPTPYIDALVYLYWSLPFRTPGSVPFSGLAYVLIVQTIFQKSAVIFSTFSLRIYCICLLSPLMNLISFHT